MRSRSNSLNLWLVLALPIVGVIGWVAGRLISRRTAADQGEPRLFEQEPPEIIQEAKVIEPENAMAKIPAGHALRYKQAGSPIFYILLVPFLILATAVIVLAFYHLPVQIQANVPGGNEDRGKTALQTWGCGACHTIPGVTGATGKVGPTLAGLSDRGFIAGHLQNNPDNMIQWIMHPQEISPGVDMPDTGVPESVARDMAAYLYSIR